MLAPGERHDAASHPDLAESRAYWVNPSPVYTQLAFVRVRRVVVPCQGSYDLLTVRRLEPDFRNQHSRLRRDFAENQYRPQIELAGSSIRLGGRVRCATHTV